MPKLAWPEKGRNFLVVESICDSFKRNYSNAIRRMLSASF